MSDICEPSQLGPYTPNEVERAADLFARHYDELLDIARRKRRRFGPGDSLLTADLVHSAFIRLKGGNWQNDKHFLAAATLAIRHSIIDHARSKLSRLRQSGDIREFDEQSSLLPEFKETPEDILMIADLMETMAATKPQWQRIVDARYFFGLTEEEAASVLGLSVRTVRREWKAACQWLGLQLRNNDRPGE